MKTNPWLRVFACGAAVGVGSLLGVPLWGADDDPPASNNNQSSSPKSEAPPSEFALTKELLGKNAWTAAEIDTRQQHLCDIAIQLWPLNLAGN